MNSSTNSLTSSKRKSFLPRFVGKLQFNLRSLILFSCGVSLIFAWPHIIRRYQASKLARFAGKDFRELSPAEQAEARKIIIFLSGKTVAQLPLRRIRYIWRSRMPDAH